jgi:hypothetical protein
MSFLVDAVLQLGYWRAMKLKTETIEKFIGAEVEECGLLGAEYISGTSDAREITISFGDVGFFKLCADVAPENARVFLRRLQAEIESDRRRTWRLVFERA